MSRDINKMVEKNIEIINYLIDNNTFRECLEYIKAYEFGMNWMENMKGGDRLHYSYNRLLDLAEEKNNIVVDYDNDEIRTSKETIKLGDIYE